MLDTIASRSTFSFDIIFIIIYTASINSLLSIREPVYSYILTHLSQLEKNTLIYVFMQLPTKLII